MTFLDDVTHEEKDAIEELKRRIKNDLTPKLREDQSLYYRFLKARDFNVQKAEDMLRKHIAWRKEFQVDTLLTDYKPPEVLLKYCSTNFIGFDKEGFPIRYIDMAGDPKGIFKSAKKIDLLKFNLQIMEQDVQCMEEQSKKLGKPVTTVLYIYNFGDMTFAKASNKSALEMMLHYAKIYQDNYPERIKAVIQINASIYYYMLFSVVKNILAPAVMNKIKVFGTDGWKEALLEMIDADTLPAFLGGNRTDPDGNPLCHSLIVHPETVPDSYYLQKSERKLSLSPGVKKLTVTRFSKTELTFEVKEPDSFIEWEFETKSRDIGFGVYFKGNSPSHSKPVEILPKQRIDTCYEPETGMYKCEKAGTYIVVFDNSYSWIHPKEIHYRMRIIGPNDNENKEWE